MSSGDSSVSIKTDAKGTIREETQNVKKFTDYNSEFKRISWEGSRRRTFPFLSELAQIRRGTSEYGVKWTKMVRNAYFDIYGNVKEALSFNL